MAVAATVEESDAREGTIIGARWQIVRKLAEGGMGAVYVARHNVTGRFAALKVMNQIDSSDDSALTRFRREARAAADIGHPGIAEVYDADVDPDSGQVYMAMELLDGESLRATIESKRCDKDEVVKIVLELLEPLAAAHERGCVHRDLKPENIFICYPGTARRKVKLLDFGIARFDDATHLTRTGTVMGTPHYMSPEHATDAKGVTPAADVWAVGVLLYEMLSGCLPFEGTTLHAVIVNACTQPHASLSERSADLPVELVALVDRCLSKDPAERFTDAADLGKGLAALLPKPAPVPGEFADGVTDTGLTVEIPMNLSAANLQQQAVTETMSLGPLLGVRRRTLSQAALWFAGFGGLVAAVGGGMWLAAPNSEANPEAELLLQLAMDLLWVGAGIAGLALAVSRFLAFRRKVMKIFVRGSRAPAVTLPPVEKPGDERRPIRGPAHARVSIVQFGEFSSKESKRLRYTLSHVTEKYPGMVRLLWCNNADPSDVLSISAAAAGREAFARGGSKLFWKMHDLLFADQAFAQEDLERYARQLHMNIGAFRHSLRSDMFHDVLASEGELAAALGLDPGCSACFVNGQLVPGDITFEEISEVIDTKLVTPVERVSSPQPRETSVPNRGTAVPQDDQASVPAPRPTTQRKRAATTQQSGRNGAQEMPPLATQQRRPARPTRPAAIEPAHTAQASSSAATVAEPPEAQQEAVEVPEGSAAMRQILIQYQGAKYAPGTITRAKDDARAAAEEARAQAIKPGTDFREMAKAYSDDPRARKHGGDLGVIKRGKLPGELDDVAFKLNPGRVSPVIETQFGFHILQRYG